MTAREAAASRQATDRRPAEAQHGKGFFPIMNWDEPQMEEERNAQMLQSLQECNFTVAGFVAPDRLPVCEELGLKAIVTIPGGPHRRKAGPCQKA